MIELKVNSARIEILKKEVITTGRVGLKVHFDFGPSWDGLYKVVVFESGVLSEVKFLTEDDHDTVEVPEYVLRIPDQDLTVAVKGLNEDNTVKIPTIYADLGEIKRGADADKAIAQAFIGPTGESDLAKLLATINGKLEELENAKSVVSTVKHRCASGEPEFEQYIAEDKPNYIKVEFNFPQSYIEKNKDNLYIDVAHCFKSRGKKYHWEYDYNLGIGQTILDTRGYGDYSDLATEWLIDKDWYDPNKELKEYIVNTKISLTEEDLLKGYKLINPYELFKVMIMPLFESVSTEDDGESAFRSFNRMDADEEEIVENENDIYTTPTDDAEEFLTTVGFSSPPSEINPRFEGSKIIGIKNNDIYATSWFRFDIKNIEDETFVLKNKNEVGLSFKDDEINYNYYHLTNDFLHQHLSVRIK